MLVMPFGGVRMPRTVASAQNLVDLGESFAHRWSAWLGRHELYLDLDFLAFGEAEVFIEFDGLAVNLAVQCLCHGSILLFVVLRHLTPLLLRLGLGFAARGTQMR